ncbi:hypothetical protein BWI97_15900 [Siphonobacter sp. BAB-5405]|uniref:XRE family transcriptional regulator n=1 Tax=Siphonobacter sp. BAB-5405 TaxID=1864825 RepID=UPI000C7FFAF3|nr:XRE family transcriptional regulator [Siphonobacter sp. BAB-5405]PMD94879.1 hypothetical protein BWI97_15900 [Siphonobacter sp. BAB-5405]
MNPFEKTGKRIEEARLKMGLNKVQFSTVSGIDNSLLGKYERGAKEPSKNDLKKIAAVTGLPMAHFLEESEINSNNGISHATPTQVAAQFGPGYVPYYDIEATMGKVEMFEDFPEVPTGYIYAPEFTGCKALRAWGDSMYTRIMPGAVLFLYYMESKKYIDYGQIYLIVADGLRMVKYIQKNDNNELVTLVSENKTYPPFEIEKKDIQHLFLVKGYWNQLTN